MNCQMKRYIGQGKWEGAWCFPEHCTPSTCVQKPWSSLYPALFSFNQASLPRHNWLNHWPLVIHLTFSSPLQPSRSVDGAVSCNPLATLFFLLATSPILGLSRAFPKNHFININLGVWKSLLWITKDSYGSYHLGNSRGFRSPVPGTMNEDWNMYFLVYHNSQERFGDWFKVIRSFI